MDKILDGLRVQDGMQNVINISKLGATPHANFGIAGVLKVGA